MTANFENGAPGADTREAAPAEATRREIVEAILTVCKRSRNAVPTSWAFAPKAYQAGVSAVETFVRKLHETALEGKDPTRSAPAQEPNLDGSAKRVTGSEAEPSEGK